MSDRRLLVSDADIDIARLLIKLDRLDGRASDPATHRIANAAAFDGADANAEYEVADDVVTDSTFEDVDYLGAASIGGVQPAGLGHVVRRRPWVRVRPNPATPGVPAL